MGPAQKRSERDELVSGSGSEDEGFSNDEVEFASKRSKWDSEDVSGSGSEAESDEENDGEGYDEEEDEGDGDEAEPSRAKIDAEMDELEKQYHHLRSEEQNLLKNFKSQKDEDALKGQAVKNQKALWDKTLEFRFLLQKAFSSSNRLPKEPVRMSFCQTDSNVDKAYSDLICSSKQTLNSMFELQEALLEKNPLILQVADGNSKESCDSDSSLSHLKKDDDEEWLQIHRMNCRIAPFRNNSIDKWQRKTQVTTGVAAFKGKLHAFNQNVSEQVAGYMRDPSKLINRMQLSRSTVNTFGKVAEELETIKEESISKEGNEDGDPELLDDSEFYQQILKEFLESCNLTSSETAFYALRKLQPKKRKVVDRRASKSRKIRYNVHEKIVNFMAPIPMVQSSMAPRLFENLFGKGNQKSSSVA